MQLEQFQAFIESQQLPEEYLEFAFKAYQIVIDDVLEGLKTKQPFILGINGCQGSGKSTTAAFLQNVLQSIYHLNVVNISLDDFYLSKCSRLEKSNMVHPLFATRGVPGTHDIELALTTIQQIISGKRPFISRFNKAMDDLFPEEEWDQAPEKVDVIILEGWFLCAKPQDESRLTSAINSLEKKEDPHGIWRKHVNEQLAASYQNLFKLVDCLIMLKAPSFDAVLKWRLEQENKLAKKLLLSKELSSKGSAIMSESEIKRFVHFFQRLTENMLIEMPERADHCYYLNTERQIVHERHRNVEH